ncbi:hypothetical protein PR048_007298 [Dryococelus australis]|uniref:Uncharacterized protein n=1 Tax=Dryococelus australis TaxID=614101 RepID=A0ABQ9ID79_9NEOP|nr:hypothetical protein PR048_007298 [Dryococelus australis]
MTPPPPPGALYNPEITGFQEGGSSQIHHVHLAYLELFSASKAVKRWSHKNDTATHINCGDATKLKSLNWRTMSARMRPDSRLRIEVHQSSLAPTIVTSSSAPSPENYTTWSSPGKYMTIAAYQRSMNCEKPTPPPLSDPTTTFPPTHTHTHKLQQRRHSPSQPAFSNLIPSLRSASALNTMMKKYRHGHNPRTKWDIDESEIQNHEILLVQRFYVGTKIKLDPSSGLGSFCLGSGEMLVQPAINYSPPTQANRVRFPAGLLPGLRTWKSCQTMPLVDEFSWRSPVSSTLALERCFVLTSLHPHRLSRLRPTTRTEKKKKKKKKKKNAARIRVAVAESSQLAAEELALTRFHVEKARDPRGVSLAVIIGRSSKQVSSNLH